jgi:hypothetical protein
MYTARLDRPLRHTPVSVEETEKCYVTRKQCDSVQKHTPDHYARKQPVSVQNSSETAVQKQIPVQKFINRHQQQQYISVFITAAATYFIIHYSSSKYSLFITR